MNFLFDLTPIQPRNKEFHGSGVYGEAIFFALLERTKEFMGVYDSKLYINPKILESGIKLYDTNQISPVELVKKENVDVFYTPVHLIHTSDEWSLDILVRRYVITLHDISILAMPNDSLNLQLYYDYYYTNFIGKIKNRTKFIINFFTEKYFFKKQKEKIKIETDKLMNMKNADYITVSEHSKYSIISSYPYLAKKEISVFYSPLKDELIELPHSKFERMRYFLLTSSARWSKNNLRAVWAFDELFSERLDLDFKVILTGVKNEKIFTNKMKNKSKFIFLGYVERAELLSLHKNAYAFIYPSLNEGFGYPPLESMRYGVPVAASGTSSIPEICQNAAIYFDPYNVSEIKNRILQLLNGDIHAEYSARAIERYRVVSEKQKWDLEKIVSFILGEKL